MQLRTLIAGIGIVTSLTSVRGNGPDEIVVEGKTQSKAEMIKTQIEVISQEAGGQLGRFIDSVCPRVIGMEPPFGEKIEERIRKTSAEVGAQVVNARCDPNLYVVFSDNPLELLKKLSSSAASIAIKRGEKVQAWHSADERNEDGQGKAQRYRELKAEILTELS